MTLMDIFRKKTSKVPYIAFHAEQTLRGSYEVYEKKILNSSVIMLIMGKRGSGKTATGMKFLELIHKKSKKKCYIYGYEKTRLPFWVKKTNNIEDVPENTALIIDEGAVSFSSREAMKGSNKYLGKLMAVARHKNLTLIIITQNSGMVDLNVLRLADSLILKEPSLMQTQFERKAIADLYKKVNPHFEKIKIREKYFFVIDDDFEGMLMYDLPEFWSRKVSKSYKNL